MTIYVHNVGRVRSIIEANGSFCTEGSIGSFDDLPVVEGTTKVVMDRPQETPALLQQNIHGYPTKIHMPRRGKFDFSLNLRGLSSRATGAATGLAALFGNTVYSAAFGGTYVGTGTTITTGATTTVLPLTSAAGMREGGALVCATGSGGALECREIKTISSNTVTLKAALSGAPSNGSTVYGAITYYLGNQDGSTVTSLQMAVEGQNNVDRWLLKGGQIASPPTFELKPGTIPRSTWSLQFADHKLADGSETSMNLTSSAISDGNYTSNGINAVMDSEFRVRQNGTSTATLYHPSEIVISPNVAYVPQMTPGGTNNIKQWVPVHTDGPACTLEFVLPHEDNIWRSARDNGTVYGVAYQIGSGTTNGGFMMTMYGVIDDVQREDVGGIAGQRVKMYARLDAETTTNSDGIQKSPFRIHVF